MYCGFSKKLITGIVCQRDGLKLSIKEEIISDTYTITQGTLICSRCGLVYEIKDGVLDARVGQKELDTVLLAEIDARDIKAASYDERFAPRYAREIPSTIAELGNISGKTIVEYGCGTGRMTMELLKSGAVLANDFSRNSLLILSQKLKGKNNIALVLGNAVTLILSNSYFDLALSAQVFEHIPDRVSRNKFLKNVRNSLKKYGKFVCSAYHQDLRRRLEKKPQDGYHASQIFYHYFYNSEIKAEFSRVFEIKKVKNIDITLPLEMRLNMSKYYKGMVSRISEYIPFVSLFGHLVLVVAVKDGLDSDYQLGNSGPHYGYGFLFNSFLRKEWFWFTRPVDVGGLAMVNFFSYEKVSAPGFKIKEGLTTAIDLTQSLETIWSNMRETFIREQIKRGQNNGIVVEHDDNFADFKTIYDDFRLKKGLPREKYETFLNGTLFSAYYDSRMLAGVVYVGDGESFRAWQIASARLSDDSKINGIIGRANRLVVWEAIKYAKEAGFKRFDLGGINPDSKDPGTVRIAEFKEAFGGIRIPCYFYSKIYSPLLRYYNRLRN